MACPLFAADAVSYGISTPRGYQILQRQELQLKLNLRISKVQALKISGGQSARTPLGAGRAFGSQHL